MRAATARARHARARERATWADVFAVREFRGLFAAATLSTVGDQLAKIALSILVFDRTHNAFFGALTYAVSMLPALLAGPMLGWLADRRPRRQVMVACDLARVVLVAIMIIPGMSVAGLLGLLFVVSFFDSPFQAARAAMLPDVLEGELYAVGQSIGSFSYQMAQVLGFAIGGAVVSVLTSRGALAVDLVTFVISAVLVRFVSPDRPAPHRDEGESRWAMITGGAVETLGRPLLRRLLGLTAVSFGLIIATEGLGVSYARQVGSGDVAVGLLTAAVPVGTAAGLLLVVRIPPSARLDATRLLGVSWGIPLVATWLTPPVWVAVLLWAAAGFLGSFSLLANVMFARALTAGTRGRAFAFAQSALVAVQGIGLLVFGAIARSISPSRSVAYAGVAAVLVCGYLALRLRPEVTNPTKSDATAITTLRDGLSTRPRPSTGLSSSVDRRRYPTVASDLASPTDVAVAKPVASPPDPQRRMAVRAVTAISILVVIAAVGVTALVHLPRPYSGPPHMSWVLLAAVFLGVSLMPLHFQRGESAQSLLLGQVPTAIGLFFVPPIGLLLGVLIGFSVKDLRTRPGTKFAVNRATAAIEIVTAILIFDFAAPPHDTINGLELLIAAVAIIAGDCAGYCYLSLSRWWVQGVISGEELRNSARFAALSGLTVSAFGLLAVIALAADSAAGLVLVVVGVSLAYGFRKFADVQEENAGLGRLYAFQEEIGALVPRGSSLFPVLHRTKALLLAGEVMVELPEPRGRRLIRIDAENRESERIVHELETQDSWAPPAGLSVALKDAGNDLGLLRVGSRLGKVRGFNASDLHLLETLALHVSDALQRGTLIERLHEAATHDSLTGLLTLNEFMRQLDEVLLHERATLVVSLNVARLKDINDSLGHQAGDALLQQVATRLKSAVSRNALIARAGGGEFVVAVSGVDPAAAGGLVEAMTTVTSGLVQVLDVTIDLRSRAGWLVAPTDGRDAATLVRRADLALGAAKTAYQSVGRFTGDLDVDGGRRLRLVHELRRAIVEEQLSVVYQPLVTPADGRVIGVEALARWTHTTFGVVSPDEFIQIAEQSGMISDLTDYVLVRALKQVRTWHAAGHDVHVAVNLSARCLADMSLPGRVLDMLAAERLSPSRLTLEVTETSVAEDPARALAVLDRLSAIGVRLSIDDFGTGYSSLASLKNFPVQEVKLDRAFLLDLDVAADEDAQSDLALLAAVVSLGHSMNLDIVAEGVETPQAYRRLHALGIDILQGYYIGHPVSANDVQWQIRGAWGSSSRVAPEGRA